jgi:hypothetical protein
MPDPVGQPDLALCSELPGAQPHRAGGGDTDWTLAALQIAAAPVAGPGT